MVEPRSDDFFVGYLPLSARGKRRTLQIALVCLLLILTFAGLAGALRDPTPATGLRSATLTGRLDARGYGVLWTELDGALTPVLLAGGGKFGAPPAAKQLFGRAVEAQGLLLSRAGYHMLELSHIHEQPALPPALAGALTRLTSTPLGTIAREGEIVDSKCWLGRMKPGEGRTHRACAQFCIQGGMPPLLVTRERGELTQYILVDREGAPINEAVLPFVAEPVRVTGRAERVGPLLFLRTDAARIRRL